MILYHLAYHHLNQYWMVVRSKACRTVTRGRGGRALRPQRGTLYFNDHAIGIWKQTALSLWKLARESPLQGVCQRINLVKFFFSKMLHESSLSLSRQMCVCIWFFFVFWGFRLFVLLLSLSLVVVVGFFFFFFFFRCLFLILFVCLFVCLFVRLLACFWIFFLIGQVAISYNFMTALFQW